MTSQGQSGSAAPDDYITVAEHARFRRIDDELVILDLAGGDYFALNEVGAKLWEKLAAGLTPGQAAVALEGDYEVGADVLLRDCLTLVDELLGRGLVKKAAR